MATTIQISDNVQRVLQDMKLFNRETYNDVIGRMIEDNLELTEATKKEIEAAKTRISRGDYLTHEEVERRLGI
jgi:predicted transcriptional regulator